jgi:hypothetical protein
MILVNGIFPSFACMLWYSVDYHPKLEMTPYPNSITLFFESGAGICSSLLLDGGSAHP